MNTPQPQEAIAIIGMAGRFPQARNLEEFWRNLRDGRECVSFFKDEQVQWLPIEHPPRLTDPNYVKARAVLENADWFDAGFFHLNPKEAEIMDPQHRVFLECAWEALESAGCNPDTYPGLIGVFAGASMNTYLFTNLLTNPEVVKDFGLFSSMIMNDGDFVPTRVSYKFNLRGPSINVQTACSTSLVAVCLAAQNLLGYRCDVALAGGVSITYPPQRGQHHQEGGILSPDGHCRTFDENAAGTVLGDGAGVVVLKRLSDALADGDRICAVIKGTAINNDGSVKIGYTAPSSDGQAEAIAMAQAEAQVEPESISYIEAHGTGTPLGDPIEIEGLTKAFGVKSGQKQFCAIGSVKSNIGHLDIAAGVAGLIKTVLALQHGEIPPSLHFKRPNPKIDFGHSPFFVNAALRPWAAGKTPRRAGVSSFGIGGTNAHAVLEEAPAVEPSPRAKPGQLLVLSARTATALEAATDNLAAHLKAHPTLNLADVACTLQVGRKLFTHRRAFVCDDVAGAADVIAGRDAKRTVTGHSDAAAPRLVFLFPGQGAQAVNMGRELYESDAAFKADVDRCCQILKPLLGADLREVLYPTDDQKAAATEQLTQTRITQPALFVIEYALARRWLAWGLKPKAMIGHSLGEYVAACIAGVFSLEDALALVAERARLMQAQPAGAMLAVRLAEAQVRPLLGDNLALAAINAPGLSVVSGPFDAIDALEQRLAASAIPSKRLATSHAFHSAMMESALAPLEKFIRERLKPAAPQIPWVSNVTGDWITPAQAKDPAYWSRHLRSTVRFADGVAKVLEAGPSVLLEVGPGQTLTGLARQHPAAGQGATLVASLGRNEAGDRTALLRALGEIWIAGLPIDWRGGIHGGERRQVVSLPTYPFERKRYCIEPAPGTTSGAAATQGQGKAKAASTNGTHPAEPAEVSTGGKAAAPASTVEVLRQLLHDLSGLDLAKASEDATFFELGFDSLFLTQASRAVANRFGCNLTFRQLREDYPTLARLARYLDGQGAPAAAVKTSAAAVTAAPAPTEKRLPLTFAQREMWFASQLGSALSAAYNECTIIRLSGPLDQDALNRALQKLVGRHESLRARFESSGEAQVIPPAIAASLAQQDLPAPAPEKREAALNEWINQELRRPFDLVKGPAWRFTLLRFDANEHVLACVVHHIICDGWSLGIVARELGELYSAERGGRDSTLALAPAFSDYVARPAGESAAWSAAEKFWPAQFADAIPVLDLPTDRPRPVERTFEGGFALRSLSPEVAAGVKRLCAERQCTPFTALFAAFSVLIHRLSGQDDVVIGVPSTAQVMDGQEHLVGHFANLLPVRSRLTGVLRFDDYLKQSSEALSASLEHWRYPFAKVVQALNIPRDSSRVPLAPVIFNTTRRRGALRYEGLAAEVVSNPKPLVNFDLNFNFALADDGITLGCYFSRELYDEATIARWFGHFETLLRAITARSDEAVGDLPLLTESEQNRIVHEWNATRLDYPRDTCLYDLFNAQALATPERVAVVGQDEQLTYAVLNQRVTRVAAALRAAGVAPDALVGVMLGRTPQLIVGILGVLKAGGAYVPLDPSHPKDRLDFIIRDTGMKVLITEQAFMPQVPDGDFDVIALDDELALAASVRRASGHAPARVTPENLAYVIYTSGSTGRPKGVAVPQRGVAALIAWARQAYSAEEMDGVLYATAATFDVSVFESIVPLCLGGKIIVADNLLHLGQLPATSQVRLISGVPSAVAEVVRTGKLPPGVRTVNVAGEPCPQALVDELYARPHIQRVIDVYGPTETTVYSTGGQREAGGRANIGRPLPNEQAYILDERLRPVPIGVRGELCLGGEKVARGYWRRPELTAEKFVPNPFAAETTDHGRRTTDRNPELRTPNSELQTSVVPRMYRTGDVARFLPDGRIEYLGRRDHQVKLRGYRIELGEIESELSRSAAVAESVVVVRPDAVGGPRLVAYVVPRSAGLDGAKLRNDLRQRLPEYMVPAAVMVLEKIPRNTSGKVDRAALPDPDFTPTSIEPPRNTTEELLVAIWCDVLGLSRVGIRDNFFELGGHSLLATQVITRVNESLGVEISLGQFFIAPTVAGLAPAIEAALIAQIITNPEEEREPSESAVLTADQR